MPGHLETLSVKFSPRGRGGGVGEHSSPRGEASGWPSRRQGPLGLEPDRVGVQVGGVYDSGTCQGWWRLERTRGAGWEWGGGRVHPGCGSAWEVALASVHPPSSPWVLHSPIPAAKLVHTPVPPPGTHLLPEGPGRWEARIPFHWGFASGRWMGESGVSVALGEPRNTHTSGPPDPVVCHLSLQARPGWGGARCRIRRVWQGWPGVPATGGVGAVELLLGL